MVPQDKLMKKKISVMKSNMSHKKRMPPKKVQSTQNDHLTNRAKTRANIKVNEDEVSSPGDSSDDLTSEHSSTEDSSDFSSLDDSLSQSSEREFDRFKDVYYDCNSQDCEDCDRTVTGL